MKVVFIMSVGSHQNATFGLAKDLVKIGHKVIYAGTAKGIYGEDLRENVVSQGYSYILLDPYEKLSFDSLNVTLNRAKEEFVSLAYNLIEDHIFEEFIASAHPDLILLDIHFPLYALVFSRFNLRVVFLSTELYTGKTENSPPLTSSIVPENSVESKEQIRDAWRKHSNDNGINPLLRFLIDELSTRNNLSSGELLTEKCVVLFGLRYTELILWPIEFEFNTSSKEAGVFYIGSYVDKERYEIDIESLNSVNKKPMIYFAIGTVLDHHFLLDFVDRMIKAFMLMPEFNFIISGGRLFEEIKSLLLPKNVKIHKYVPQLKVLEKSELMITMGGANSIKECLELGVPMLCFPFHSDQFGNSARVEFHKLGVRGDVLHDRPEDIVLKISKILRNNEYKENVRAFQKNVKAKLSPSELNELMISFKDTKGSI